MGGAGASGSEGRTRCPNCGAQASSHFCPECGQKQEDLPTLRRWVEESTEDVLSVERGALRTVRVLLNEPGRLTREWLDGKRARWVKPFRLYLLATLAFFTVSLFLPMIEPRVDAGDLDDPADLVEELAVREQLREATPQALFVLMPVFAILLKLGFWKSAPYVGHLVHALHLHAAGFLVMILFWLGFRLPVGFTIALGIVLGLWLVVYLFRSIRRAYAVPRWRAVLEGIAILGVYGLLVTGVLAASAFVRAESRTDRLEQAREAHWASVDALTRGDEAAAEELRAEMVLDFMRSPGFTYDADARWHMGALMLDAGQVGNARIEAEQGLALNPTHLLLLGLAAEVADARGDSVAAADYRRRLREAREPELAERGGLYGERHAAPLRRYLEAAGGGGAAGGG